MPAPLSDLQTRFVEEYLKVPNATEAYKKAGYKATGRAAENNASRLLGNAGVAAAIAAGQAARSKRTGIDQDWVVSRLVIEAEHTGEDASHGARVKALELLGKHVGMWPNKLQVEGTLRVEVVEQIVVSREDAAKALSALAGAG